MSFACFIGNSVYDGRHGVESWQGAYAYSFNCSGNSLKLFSAFDATNDWPGFAAEAAGCLTANVVGNTLIAGGYGFAFSGPNTNALILNNQFGTASYRAVGCFYTGDSLSTAQIFGNTLGEGVSFHVQLHYADSFGWFLGNNTNVNTNSIVVPLFTDPASAAVHIYN
jgi:hypothetical protein